MYSEVAAAARFHHEDVRSRFHRNVCMTARLHAFTFCINMLLYSSVNVIFADLHLQHLC
jgi:hypothetical protein